MAAPTRPDARVPAMPAARCNRTCFALLQYLYRKSIKPTKDRLEGMDGSAWDAPNEERRGKLRCTNDMHKEKIV